MQQIKNHFRRIAEFSSGFVYVIWLLYGEESVFKWPSFWSNRVVVMANTPIFAMHYHIRCTMYHYWAFIDGMICDISCFDDILVIIKSRGLVEDSCLRVRYFKLVTTSSVAWELSVRLLFLIFFYYFIVINNVIKKKLLKLMSRCRRISSL